MTDQSDEHLAGLVQAGNREAYGELVKRYEAKMLRYAQKFLFGPEDREDLVQDVFLKAYTNIQSFDTKRRFSPWLYRIAHNEYINAVGKKTKYQVFPFDLDVLMPHLVARETANGAAEQKDLRRVLDEHLGKLDPKYREPLVLYYFEELDYREIADILRIPVSTVGVRLQRGKNQLQKLIAQSGSAII